MMIRKWLFIGTMTCGVLFLCGLAPTTVLAQDFGPIPPKFPSVPKWSQLPEDAFGENVPSDIDWRVLLNPDPPIGVPAAPNWVVADDFRSDGRPITTVRWWGSYFNEATQPVFNDDSQRFDAVIEEGYVISFHEDIPADPNTGAFSRPGDLLGTYIAPEMAVHIVPTDLRGWDQHRVWEYTVDLEWTHLDHAIPGLSEPDAFLETAGTIYWISIVAENGHELIFGPGGPDDWQFVDTQDPVEQEHFWGWHTSPDRFNDVPVDGSVTMNGPEWIYGQWNPIRTQHGEGDMAFELLTPIPEPGSIALLAAGLVGCLSCRRRR